LQNGGGRVCNSGRRSRITFYGSPVTRISGLSILQLLNSCNS
jgi:hypothetical protein